MTEQTTYFTIGKLKDELKQYDPSMYVYFEFGGFRPVAVSSWRGACWMPAIEYTREGQITVAELLINLELGTSRVYGGWKGGEYQFNDNQVLMVSELGCSTKVVIVGTRASTLDYINKNVVYLSTMAIRYTDLPDID